MANTFTFGQKIGAGFAVVVGCGILIGAVAIYSLRKVVDSKDRVIAVNGQNLIDAERLHTSIERAGGSLRGFLLTKEDRFVEAIAVARASTAATMARLKTQVYTDEGQQLVLEIERALEDYRTAADRVVMERKGTTLPEAAIRLFDADILPKRDVLEQKVNLLTGREERLLMQGREAATETVALAISILIGIALLSLLTAIAIAMTLTRALGRQIGTAVHHVSSSSTELQAAANEQATASREQSTAMSEITATISELLATSRQIAESARHVAHIAEETATAARGGDDTVQKTQEALARIRRQVDLIVSHMLELGKKSQQIGGVLEIINELAEQTNILAINATIEAAGAGDAGKRFAVVADEIRKLADRVGGSTKEIRGLIDEVRTAVNTTVMATEGGSKAVDAGTRQFVDVQSALKQIVELVATTTDAAREIELSTRQQATAVEQVKVAVSDVAQAARETEASSRQTLQTSSQLSTLSRDLTHLIQPRASA